MQIIYIKENYTVDQKKKENYTNKEKKLQK